MPRASRHYLPGHAWHITHRCHKKEFLLKFSMDRERYVRWLYEAKKRYGLIVLNYTVTSNHIHVLVVDPGNQAISRSMQLIAGRTGQEYNQRKKRKGAFWEDRYHATAIQTGKHLVRCMMYIDLNMVRAGAVKHPSSWPFCGYNEIIDPPKRYAIVNRTELIGLLGIGGQEELRETYKRWIEDMLSQKDHAREAGWTESLAIGDEAFVEEIKESLLSRAMGRKPVREEEGMFELREAGISYGHDFAPEKGLLSPNNTCLWDISL